MILLKEQEMFGKSDLPMNILYGDRGVGKTVACLSRLWTLLLKPNRNIGFVCLNRVTQTQVFNEAKETLKGRCISVNYHTQSLTLHDTQSTVYFIDSQTLTTEASLRFTDCIVDDADIMSNQALTNTFLMTIGNRHEPTLAYTSCLYSDKIESLQDCYSLDVNTLTLYIRHPHFNPFQKV
jgi:hypothetical protein